MVGYDFDKEVGRVMKSVEGKLEKYCRQDPNITVDQALSEVWGRLDIALIGVGSSYAARRVKVMNTAIDRLGLLGNKKRTVSDYLNEKKVKKSKAEEDRKFEDRLRRFLKKYHF